MRDNDTFVPGLRHTSFGYAVLVDAAQLGPYNWMLASRASMYDGCQVLAQVLGATFVRFWFQLIPI